MAMLYLRNKPIGAISSGASGGGHTIENPSGTDMTQRSNLQFTDADVTDDSTNDRTEISVVRKLTQAEFDELTPEEQNRGVIVIKGANPIYVPSNNAVSVTADGVKTYGQLFSELYALADATKVTRNAKLVMTNTSGDVVYNIERNYGTGITFVKTRNVVNDYLVETIWLGTTSAYYLAATEASSTTFTNSTNSVPASGVRFTLYYNIVCTDRTEVPPHQVSTGYADIVAWKSGCVASIHFVNSATAGAGVAFATFPDELKPNHIVEFKDSYSGKRIQINTSGAVSCTEALSNAPIRGTLTYVTKS